MNYVFKAKKAPIEKKDSGTEFWDEGFSLKAAEAKLSSLGITFPEQPEEIPQMPEDITRLGLDEIGKLYAQFVAWNTYASAQCSLMDIVSTEDAVYLVKVKSSLRLKCSGAVKERDAKVEVDEACIAAEQKKLISTAKYTLLKAVATGYEKSASALSREISRRQGDNSVNYRV